MTGLAELRSIDTNILARWLLQDDPKQTAIASSVLAESVYVSGTVLLETGWVLAKSIGFSRGEVADLLEQVVDLETVVLENRAAMIWAIDRYRHGADWGDVVHLAESAAVSSVFLTFDKALAKEAGADTPLPVETLRA